MHNFGAKLNISTSMLPEKNVFNCLGDNYLARVVPGGAPPASTKYPPSSHAGPNLRSQINMRQFTPPHHRVFTVPVLRHLGGSFGGLRIRHLGGSFGGHRIRHLLGFGSFEFLAGSSLELELGRNCKVSQRQWCGAPSGVLSNKRSNQHREQLRALRIELSSPHPPVPFRSPLGNLELARASRGASAPYPSALTIAPPPLPL